MFCVRLLRECLRTRFILAKKHWSNNVTNKAGNLKFDETQPELDYEYLLKPCNKSKIEENIKCRKGVGNIDLVEELYNSLKCYEAKSDCDAVIINKLKRNLLEEALKIPNRSCDLLKNYGENPSIVNIFGVKPTGFKLKEFSELAKTMEMVRTENLGNLSGHRSYYFIGELAELEHALVKFTVKTLQQHNFKLVSVPDLLHSDVVQSCGMSTQGERTQVYMLDPSHYGNDICLSGTAELALAGFLMNENFKQENLPMRLAAVSRCYRAETSSLAEERGIFRVHQFTKVEMFGVTDQNSSDNFLEEFREIQERHFESLGLHFKTLDMPPHELGAPAYRKFDIEAWLPGRKIYGEISSCSNCTDYQSRRLNIKYIPSESSTPLHAHTINGTACAVPRMMIALLETHQQPDGTVSIPKPLQQYMNGKTTLGKQSGVPDMKFMRSKHREKRTN